MQKLALFLFWGATVGIAYTYLGYPFWIYVRSQLRPHPWLKQSRLLSVSVILPVHNCGAVLKQKIDQLIALDYPKDQIEFIVVSDGSNDDTERILAEHPLVRSVVYPQRRGKAAALNAGMQIANGEVLVFLDIRPRIAANSLQILLANFADPTVGCASGQLVLLQDEHDQTTEAIANFYWRYEQWIRNCESKVDSPVGVYGGFYAVRRNLASNLPPATVLDDMLQPLSVIRQGYRSVVDLHAVVYDVWPRDARNEFNRKVRTLAGNFQLIKLAPWVLSRENRLRFELISHKLLRLLVPALLMIAFCSSAALSIGSRMYSATFIAQLLLYLLAAFGAVRGIPIISRLAGTARAFCVLNLAVIVGFYRFLFTRGPLWKIWNPTIPSTQIASQDANHVNPS
jgi:cellulose synthase/poly-beta-1,6-N-acetylglucosamine synthase-like glycosyltransferase